MEYNGRSKEYKEKKVVGGKKELWHNGATA